MLKDLLIRCLVYNASEMEKLTTTEIAEMFEGAKSHCDSDDEASCYFWAGLTGVILMAEMLLDKNGPNELLQRVIKRTQEQLAEFAKIYPSMMKRIPAWQTIIDEDKYDEDRYREDK